MNRQEFIKILRHELKKLPPEEIVAATEFFEEYFDEVLSEGEMTEEELIEEMGSPKKVAAQVKADYASRVLEGEGTIANDENSMPKKKLSAVWWIVLGVCAAPVSIPLAICIGVAVLAVAIGALSIILSIYAMIIGCAVMSVFSIVMGVLSITSSGAAAAMFLGAGFVAVAMCAAAGVGAFIGTKALIKLIIRWIKSIGDRKREDTIEKMNSNTGNGLRNRSKDGGLHYWKYDEKGLDNEERSEEDECTEEERS